MDGLDLAVVPGGSAADPWTGRLPAERDEPPSAPSTGLSGTPRIDPNADAALPHKDGGCDAGDATLPGLLGLVALALIRRRR